MLLPPLRNFDHFLRVFTCAALLFTCVCAVWIAAQGMPGAWFPAAFTILCFGYTVYRTIKAAGPLNA